MNDARIKAQLSPVVCLILIILTALMTAYLGIYKGIPIWRQVACVTIVVLGLGFAGIQLTRHFRLSEEGLHVYWYGIIHTLYLWDDLPVHHVFYLDLSKGVKTSGDYIVFSTKKRLLEANGKGALSMVFSAFAFRYTPEVYRKFKRYCPALANHSARYAEI